MSKTGTAMPEMPVLSADTSVVPEMSGSSPTAAIVPASTASTTFSAEDVISAMRAAEGMSETERKVRKSADALFTESAVTTYLAVNGGVAAGEIARVAKREHLSAYKSTDMVMAHARTGALLSLPGDLPASVRPSEVQAQLYRKVVKIDGAEVKVMLTDPEHTGLMLKSTDRGDAFRQGLEIVRQKIRDAKGPKSINVGAVLTKSLEALRLAVDVADWNDNDRVIFAEIAKIVGECKQGTVSK